MNRVQVFCLSVLLYGCGKEPNTGAGDVATAPVGIQEEFPDTPGLVKTIIRDQTDRIATTGFYLNGKKESSWVDYYSNSGMTRMVTSYVQDKKEGMCLEFSTSNQLVRRYFYHNDQLHGEYKEYNASMLKEERFYDKGKQEGITKIYYDGGGILEESYYKNGVREGSAKWFDKAGNVTIDYEYKNGQLVKK